MATRLSEALSAHAMGRRPDDQLLTLNTLLQSVGQVELSLQLHDDTTVTGRLESADQYMK